MCVRLSEAVIGLVGEMSVGIEPLGLGGCVWVVHASPCSMGMGCACVAMLCVHVWVVHASPCCFFFWNSGAPLCDFLEVRSQGEAAVQKKKVGGGTKGLKLPKIQELKVLSWIPSHKFKNP